MTHASEPRPTELSREALREWHRLFGLLLTDFFTGTGFIVDVERDLSEQQQFLDVVILRRRPGRIRILFPDGLTDLTAHNLITFKSHHEALDTWAMKELIGWLRVRVPSPSLNRSSRRSRTCGYSRFRREVSAIRSGSQLVAPFVWRCGSIGQHCREEAGTFVGGVIEYVE